MSPRFRPSFRLTAGVFLAAMVVGTSGCGRFATSTARTPITVPAPVSGLSFSPDGKKLATSIGPKGTIWEADSGKELVSIENEVPSFGALVFSADGRSIAGGADKSIKIWDAATGKVRKTLDGHTAGASAVGFSNDGKILVSAASFYNFRTTIVELFLWDVEAGKKLADINTKQFVLSSMAMAPDRTTFATGSLDNSVKIWNLADRREIAVFQQSGKVLGSAYSPDGKMLASGLGWNNGQRRGVFARWKIPGCWNG